MLRTPTRIALIPVTAAVAALALAGCNDDTAATAGSSASASSKPSATSDPSSSAPSKGGTSEKPGGSDRPGGSGKPSEGATGPGPSTGGGAGTGTPPKAPCLSGATSLVGRLDGDAYPDKINDPGHTGTQVTVQWGAEDGSYGSPVSVNSLLGVDKGEDGAVAVADFHNDGTLDMLVSIVKPADGDDPNQEGLAEFRSGPLNRSLVSSHTADSDIAQSGEVQQLRIANYNKDGFPDLAILQNGGDGQLDRNVRLSVPGGGLGPFDREANDKYGEAGALSDPPAMPTDGWQQFYKSCG